jgi:hypothetical protein
MPRAWLESLAADDRARAERSIDSLRALGCPDPEHWARRELRDDWPQESRFALLRHLWSEAIGAWGDSLLWIDNLRADAASGELRDDPAAASAAAAIDRMIAAGVPRDDIARLARFVAYETVFSVVHTLDEGYDPEHEEGPPGWALMERDPLGHVTDRHLTHLHEDLPRLAPEPR